MVYSDNHRSHMAYPPNGGPCPSSHPKRIPTPFIEGWYFTNTDEIRWPVEGELVLSTGDTTGYGIHVSLISAQQVRRFETKSVGSG